MVKFRFSQVQMYSSASSRRCFKVYYSKRVQLIRLATLYHRHLNKSLHTTQWNQQKENKDDHTAEDQDYELDLITMTKKKKPKQNKQSQSSPTGTRLSNSKDHTRSINISDGANVRADEYNFKKPKKQSPSLDKEDVRNDDDLITLSEKDQRKLNARKKEAPSPLEPIFGKETSAKATNLSTQDIEQLNSSIQNNLTRLLDEEYDRQENAEKKKSKNANNLFNIVSSGSYNDSKSDQILKGERKANQESSSELKKNVKSDDDLIPELEVPQNDLTTGAAELNQDIKSDDNLVAKEHDSEFKNHDKTSEVKWATTDPRSDDHLKQNNTYTESLYSFEGIDNPMSGNEQEILKEVQDRNLSNPLNYDSTKTHIPFQEARAPKSKDTHSVKEPHLVNVSVPKFEDKPKVKKPISYTSEAPKIDEYDKIINVSKPPQQSRKQRRKELKKKKESFNFGDLSTLPETERIHKIDDIMKLLENEIPKLSKQKNLNESEINTKSLQVQQLREKLTEIQNTPSKSDSKVSIPITDLESFLKEAKKEKEIREEDQFRESRAFEFSKSMNDKNYRTLGRKNFFTPIDEALVRKLTTRSNIFKPIQQQVRESAAPKDELFFPSLSNANKNLIHEYMVLANKKKIITNENPLGEHYHTPDLFTIFRHLGDPEKYLKQINKLEKNGGWKLIGSGGDSNKILIFERFVDKEQEKKDLLRKRIINYTGSAASVFAILLAFGAYYEHEEKRESTMSKYKFDDNGKFVKSSTK